MNRAPVHTIIETRAFTRRAASIGITSTELEGIYDLYASDPAYGAVVRNTGGLRKGRVAKDGTGKSGGYRVFSFYADERAPVFLLWIIDKSDEDTLTDAQERTFKALTAELKKELRT
jgi:hypothetical protein